MTASGERMNTVTLTDAEAIELELILEANLAETAKRLDWYRENGHGRAGERLALQMCQEGQRAAASALEKIKATGRAAGRGVRMTATGEAEHASG